MKVELQIDALDPQDVPRQAEAAEATGADALVTAETGQDALMPLMIAAGCTRRIALATGIVVAFPRSPMVTALQSWYLHEYSGGRFELGLGSQVKGHIVRRYSTEWLPPGPRMRDYVQSLRAIWGAWRQHESPQYVGTHYSFTLATANTPPSTVSRQIPISVAAVNPYMLRMAAEICDGVRLHHFCSRRYLEQDVSEAIRRGEKQRVAGLPPLEISGGGFVVVGRDEREIAAAREGVRKQIAFYGSTRTYASSFSCYGWDDLTSRLHEMSLRREWDLMSEIISDEVLDEFVVSGDYDELGERVRERLGSTTNRVSLRVPLDSAEDVDNARRLVAILQALPGRQAV